MSYRNGTDIRDASWSQLNLVKLAGSSLVRYPLQTRLTWETWSKKLKLYYLINLSNNDTLSLHFFFRIW